MYRKQPEGWIKHFDFMFLDLICVELALILAFFIRYQGITSTYIMNMFRLGAVLLGLLTIIISLFFNNIYKNILQRGWLIELISVIEFVALICICLIVVLFVIHMGGRFSRLVLVYFSGIATGFLYLSRCGWKIFVRKRNGVTEHIKRRILVVAEESHVERLFQTVKRASTGDMDFIGVLVPGADSKTKGDICGVKVVGDLDSAAEFMQTEWIEETLIYLPGRSDDCRRFLNLCIEMGITAHVCLDVYSDERAMTTFQSVGGMPVLTESLRIISVQEMFIKRAMDITGAIVGLVITGVLLIILGPIIYYTDPGNIIFSQTRVGKNGRRFKMYKLRSMYRDAEERKTELEDRNEMNGLMFKMENDPRIIGSGADGKRHGIGWFMRRFSLDEFPQFWNVLRGDMSLVGTRPPTEQEFEQYEAHHRARLAMKPGITGLWQVSGRNDITDFEEIVALDLKYINTWSFTEDIKIILKTVTILLSGKGAK